jgi:hypothetical protein
MLTLNFTKASKETKLRHITLTADRGYITNYHLQKPSDKRLAKLAKGDVVSLGGRIVGLWGMAVVGEVTRDSAGTSLELVRVEVSDAYERSMVCPFKHSPRGITWGSQAVHHSCGCAVLKGERRQ